MSWTSWAIATPRAGSRATPFERLGQPLAQSNVNKLDAILRNNGIDTERISAQTDRQLWDALRGRDTGAGPLPANVQRAAGEIRALLLTIFGIRPAQRHPGRECREMRGLRPDLHQQ